MKTNNKNIKLDNALMIVAIIAVGFAFVNLMTTIDKFRDIQSLTGYATDTGIANLTNITAYTTVTTTEQLACTNFGWADTADKLEIDLRVGIGSGAAGEKTATITAEATAIA